MDKYEEMAEKCSLDLGIGMSEFELIADAFCWYDSEREKKSVALEAWNGELITASRAAEILGISVSKIIEMRQERDKETCKTCANFTTLACPIVGFEKVLLLCRRYRRIVEKEG